MKTAVRFFPLAAIQSPRPRAWAAVISGSTRTASRPAEMSVADIGGHRRSVAPGGRSSVTIGSSAVT
jgi:hypothetical protein